MLYIFITVYEDANDDVILSDSIDISPGDAMHTQRYWRWPYRRGRRRSNLSFSLCLSAFHYYFDMPRQHIYRAAWLTLIFMRPKRISSILLFLSLHFQGMIILSIDRCCHLRYIASQYSIVKSWKHVKPQIASSQPVTIIFSIDEMMLIWWVFSPFL